MYKRVLVPLDGSARAERAVPVAERIARFSGSQITLLQVVSRPAPLSGAYYGPQPPSAQWIEQDVAAAQAYLAHIAEWPLLKGLSIETRVAIGGPAAAIAEVAEAEAGANLIVMCSHGRTGAARLMMGSVAEHVARHSSTPVLVLREPGPASNAPHADADQTLRALVPLDGSLFAEAALEPAAVLTLALAGFNQAAVRLAMVLPPAVADPQIVPEDPALQRARVYLMHVADRMRALYPRLEVGWSIVPGLDASGALVRMTGADQSSGPEQNEALSGYHLIAMAAHGRSGIARLALGSVTEEVLHHTNLPLLVVRPPLAQARKVTHSAEQPGVSGRPTEHVNICVGEADSLWTPLY